MRVLSIQEVTVGAGSQSFEVWAGWSSPGAPATELTVIFTASQDVEITTGAVEASVNNVFGTAQTRYPVPAGHEFTMTYESSPVTAERVMLVTSVETTVNFILLAS